MIDKERKHIIKVDKLSYSFPQKNLYNEISFTLEDNQHCAFIGMSGIGKSTLMNMIIDPEKYNFSGKLEITPGYKIGYVSQFAKSDEVLDMTVFEYTFAPWMVDSTIPAVGGASVCMGRRISYSRIRSQMVSRSGTR